jgi:hypothetical protein
MGAVIAWLEFCMPVKEVVKLVLTLPVERPRDDAGAVLPVSMLDGKTLLFDGDGNRFLRDLVKSAERSECDILLWQPLSRFGLAFSSFCLCF